MEKDTIQTVSGNDLYKANTTIVEPEKETPEKSEAEAAEKVEDQAIDKKEDKEKPESEESEQTSKESEEEDDSEGDEDEDQKPKNAKEEEGLKKALAKQRAKRRESDERAERLERELAELKAKQANPSDNGDEKEKPANETKRALDPNDPEPDENDFEDQSDFWKEWNRWDRRQDDKARDQKNAQEKFKQEADARMAAHYERLEGYKEKNPSFQEDMESLVDEVGNVNFSLALDNAITKSEIGPDLLHELAKSPEEFKRVNSLNPLDAAIEIGRIQERILTRQKSSEKKEVKEEKKSTKAPAPLDSLKSKSSGSTKDPSKMTQKEYEAWRDAQEAKG